MMQETKQLESIKQSVWRRWVDCRNLLIKKGWKHNEKEPCCYRLGRYRICLNNAVLLPDGDLEHSIEHPQTTWPSYL